MVIAPPPLPLFFLLGFPPSPSPFWVTARAVQGGGGLMMSWPVMPPSPLQPTAPPSLPSPAFPLPLSSLLLGPSLSPSSLLFRRLRPPPSRHLNRRLVGLHRWLLSPHPSNHSLSPSSSSSCLPSVSPHIPSRYLPRNPPNPPPLSIVKQPANGNSERNKAIVRTRFQKGTSPFRLSDPLPFFLPSFASRINPFSSLLNINISSLQPSSRPKKKNDHTNKRTKQGKQNTAR